MVINMDLFSFFYSIPFVFLSVFMPIPDYFQYCASPVEFEVRDSFGSRRSFIVQNYFDYPGSFFVFPYEVEYCSFKVCGILIGIA